MGELGGFEAKTELTDVDVARMEALYAKAEQPDEPAPAPMPNALEEAAQASLPEAQVSTPVLESADPTPQPTPGEDRLHTVTITRHGVKARFQAPWMKAPSEVSLSGPTLDPRDMFANASNIVNNALGPAVIDPLQSVVREGVQVGGFKSPSANDDAQKINQRFGPAAEYFYRAGMQMVAGRGFLEEMDPREVKEAVDSIERITSNPLLHKFLPFMTSVPGVGPFAMAAAVGDALDPEGTKDVMAAAPAAMAEAWGQGPLMLIGMGQGGAVATRAAGLVPPVVKAGIQGAAGNVVFSALQGPKKPMGATRFDASGAPMDQVDLEEDALVGLLFSTGLHALARVPGVVAFTRSTMEDFAKAMFAHGERGEELLKAFHPPAPRPEPGALQSIYREAAVSRTRADPVAFTAASAEAAQRSAAGQLPATQPTRGPKGNPRVDIEPTAAVIGMDDKGNLAVHLWEVTASKHQPARLTRVSLDSKRVTQWVGARMRVSGVAPMVTHEAMQALEAKGLKAHLFPPVHHASAAGDVLETVVDRQAYAKLVRGSAPTRVEGASQRAVTPLEDDASATLGPATMLHLHGDGTWTSNRLLTREERAASMRVHQLASMTDENGVKRYGYAMSSGGDTWLAPPHPNEEIAGALVDARKVGPGQFKLLDKEELLSIAEHVPSGVAMFTPRHDPRIVSAPTLVEEATRFLHSSNILRRKSALQRAFKMSPGKRPDELARELQAATRRLAEGLGIKRQEADILLRYVVGASKRTPAAEQELEAVVSAMMRREEAAAADVAHLTRGNPDVVGPENYPGPENIPESSIRIGKPKMMPQVLKGMKLTGRAQEEFGAPPPPVELVERELGAVKSMHEARARVGAPETPEQTAARVARGQVEGALAEWHAAPNSPPPLIKLKDGTTVEVVAHESQGALTVRDAAGIRRANIDDAVAFVGDAPTRKRMFQNIEEVNQALATVNDAAVSFERKAQLRGDILEAARKDGFYEAALAKALDDAMKRPRTASGLVYQPEGAPPAPGRPAPVGGQGPGSGLPTRELPPIATAPPDPPLRAPPPELIPPSDAGMAGILARASKSMWNPVLWANRDIALAAAKSQSERSLQNVLSTSWEKRWRKLFGRKQDTVLFRQDVLKVGKGELSMDALSAKYPFVTQLRREFLETALQKRTANDERIRALGMLPERGEVSAEAEEQYLSREFFRFMWGDGEWAAHVRKHDKLRLEKALRYFEASIKDSEVIGGEGLSRPDLLKLKKAQAARYVDAIMGDPAFTEFDPLRSGTKGVPSALQSLKHRRLEERLHELEDEVAKAGANVPKELEQALAKEKEHVAVIKSLLGESTDGMAAIGTTLARQEVLIRRGEMMRDLAKVPELVSPFAGQKAADGRWFVEVPSDRTSWGRLSGKFVHPDLYEALTWAAGTPEIAKGWMSMFWRMFKANIILPGLAGFSPMAHNLMGDLMFGIMSGGLDITANPMRATRAMLQAAKSTAAMGDPAKLLGHDAELYQRAVSHGIVTPGFMELEVAGRTMKRLMQLEADPRARVWDHIMAVASPAELGKRAVGGLSKLYDAPSRLFRFAAWLGNRERILANPRKYLGERFSPGMADDLLEAHADALATRWINETYPNFDRIGRWQEGIRASGVAGAVVPTFATEDIRIHSMFPERLMRSGKAIATGNVSDGADPDLAFRTMRWAGVVMAMGSMYAAKRRANGISDDDVAEAIKATPDYVQGHGLGLFADMERDENGKVVIRDYSAFIAPLRYTYGRDDAPWPTRVVWNLVKTPIAGGVFDSPMVRIFGDPMGVEDAMGGEAKAWQKNGAGFIDTLLKTPLAPQGIQRAFGPAYRAGAFGPPSPATNTLTSKQALAHYFGLPTYPIGPEDIGRDAVYDALSVRKAAKGILEGARQERGGPAMQLKKALTSESIQQQAIDSALEEYEREVNRRFPQENP